VAIDVLDFLTPGLFSLDDGPPPVVVETRLLPAPWAAESYAATWGRAAYAAGWRDDAVGLRTDFEFFAGEDVAIEHATEAETDITGWTIVTYVGRRPSVTGTPAITPAVSVAAAITDAAAGEFTSTLTGVHTLTDLGPGRWVYQTWRTDSGSRAVLAYGELTILPDVAT
jgi:hypothetical protein